MQCIGNVSRHLELLTQLQRLLKICKRIIVLALGLIDTPNVVQAERLIGLVTGLTLDLQRFLVHLERAIVLASVFVKAAEVNERVANLLLCPDLAPHLNGFVETGQRLSRLAQHFINLGHFI